MRPIDQSEAFNSASPVFSPFSLIQIKRLAIHALYTAIILFLCSGTGGADTGEKGPTLVRGVMCETIENYLPVHPAVVFSIARDTIICFTAFDPVPETTDIFHKWYRQDRLISLTKLTLKPPKWSSFSSMQLRAIDKGPWRVDIVNIDDTVIKTLYFSISD